MEPLHWTPMTGPLTQQGLEGAGPALAAYALSGGRRIRLLPCSTWEVEPDRACLHMLGPGLAPRRAQKGPHDMGSPSGPGGAWVDAGRYADSIPPSPPSHLSTFGAADNRVGLLVPSRGHGSHNNDPH